jgi:uncharacterized membrane protein
MGCYEKRKKLKSGLLKKVVDWKKFVWLISKKLPKAALKKNLLCMLIWQIWFLYSFFVVIFGLIC